MLSVLKLGRHSATLVVKDFVNWQDSVRADVNHSRLNRLELCYKYAKICNDRWSNFEKVSPAKAKIICHSLYKASKGLSEAKHAVFPIQNSNIFIHYCLQCRKQTSACRKETFGAFDCVEMRDDVKYERFTPSTEQSF